MMRVRKLILSLVSLIMIQLHTEAQKTASKVSIVETSAAGHKLQPLKPRKTGVKAIKMQVDTKKVYQTITGFGGSFTQSSAYLLSKMSEAKREGILRAYFAPEGARYSLTRTHINSCDFSLYQYAYVMDSSDLELKSFNIAEDRKLLIPMIHQAQKISKDGFNIIASPWTAPPWMKDNKDWRGGKLLPEYRQTWALYFSKYLKAYQKEGIPIWGITGVNEPFGNGNNWESMLFSPQEMTDFVRDYLGPQLEKEGFGDVRILGFDQNRGKDLQDWADAMYKDEASSKYFAGMAIHWYASTYDYFPESLQYTHRKAPNKHLINTEACVDAQVPAWKDDNWYWSKTARDWGWTWAAENEKHLHPEYVPVFRYARDILGCLNNHVDGWVDWNMVLDRQGGPNWFKNWCTAPVIVDPENDEVYYTPLYYTLAHFSKYIRPGAKRIDLKNPQKDLMSAAFRNPDGSIAIVLFNPNEVPADLQIEVKQQNIGTQISAKAIQTILIKP